MPDSTAWNSWSLTLVRKEEVQCKIASGFSSAYRMEASGETTIPHSFWLLRVGIHRSHYFDGVFAEGEPGCGHAYGAEAH